MANQAKIKETLIGVGDIIVVDYKIIETEKTSGIKKREQKEEVKERVQPFEGTVIAINANSKSFLVRKIGVGNIGIERIFPFDSPWIVKIKVMKKGKVRRAKLYYTRHGQSHSR